METRTSRLVGIFVAGLVLVLLLRSVLSLVWGLFSLLLFVLAALAIVDVLTSRRQAASKALWVIGILVFPLLGPTTYWMIGREPARV